MFTQRNRFRSVSRRRKLPWPANKPFNILSLDGGGIRGAFTAAIIRDVQRQIVAEGHLANYFDLIAGTSTGGILAIALGLRVDPEVIFDLYIRDGRLIFPPKKFAWLSSFRRLRTALYDQRELERLLKKTFAQASLGESQTRLLVTSVVGPNPQVAVIKTDHHPDYKHDWKMPAWEAARATSAAPTFFQGHRFGRDYYLDGGLFANNPVMLAIIEALHVYDLSIEQIKVLSIGTGNAAPRLGQAAIRAGMVGWRDVISSSIYLSTDSSLSQARLLLGFAALTRLEPDSHAATIELDDWTRAHDEMPAQAEQAMSNHFDEVRSFFVQPASPWTHYKGEEPSDWA